jgi:hypothetical protein
LILAEPEMHDWPPSGDGDGALSRVAGLRGRLPAKY